MNKSRLQRVYEHIQTAPPEEFAYDAVLGTRLPSLEFNHELHYPGVTRTTEAWRAKTLDTILPLRNECGTAGCVAGHTLFAADDTYVPILVKFVDRAVADVTPGGHGGCYAELMYAAAEWLDLTADEAYFLFLWRSADAARGHALARIEHLLKGEAIEAYLQRYERSVLDYPNMPDGMDETDLESFSPANSCLHRMRS